MALNDLEFNFNGIKHDGTQVKFGDNKGWARVFKDVIAQGSEDQLSGLVQHFGSYTPFRLRERAEEEAKSFRAYCIENPLLDKCDASVVRKIQAIEILKSHFSESQLSPEFLANDRIFREVLQTDSSTLRSGLRPIEESNLDQERGRLLCVALLPEGEYKET